MPSVNDIVTVAEALEKSPIAVFPDRCVVVRNRNATCRRCVRACKAGAIEVSNNEISLDASLCRNCGACTAVCPTEALAALDPADADLAASAASALNHNGGRAVVACARIASKRLADPATYACVPCLARVDEALLLGLVAEGARDVLLVDGNCATCKLGAFAARLAQVTESTDGLLAAHGSAVRVTRLTGFPDDLLAEDTTGLFGTTRRGFFSEAVTTARETAMTAAKTTIAQELGGSGEPPAIGERLRVTEGGTLPLVSVARHDAAINALDAIGQPVAPEIDSRLFANVSIDLQTCNACGMCAMFCPTGALKRDAARKVSDPIRYLEFSACDCVQCDSCADVCWKGALTLDSRVSTAQLYDFEPRTFDLSQAKRPASTLFGK